MDRQARTARISVVTVLYGGLNTLEKTLPSWRSAFIGLPFEIIIIDNSTDDDVRLAALSLLSELRPIYSHSSSNLGFAAGANRGAKMASCESILFLNADVFMTRDAAVELLRYSDTPAAALQLRTGDSIYAGVELAWFGFLSDRKLESKRECLGPSGGGAIIQRKIFNQFGRFDSEFFAWGEDAALALRLTAGGIKTVVLPIVLVHIGGHSVTSLAGQRFKARLLARNRVWTFCSYISVRRRVVTAPFFLLALLVNGLVRKLPRRTIRPYLGGIVEGFRTSRTWTGSTNGPRV